ncbi:Protein disulfide-isomerase A4 [Halotydeus destructor]|nr:Protein disulfide-isomerase A4 [Halotydeus destructor]
MMRGYSLILALVLFYGDLGSGSVLDLSSYAVDEFRSEMDNFDSVFVKFYAPYCGHCKTMANDYKAVARKMMEEEPPVTLAEVDCTSGTGTKICKKFNVQGYPSLQLFKHGKPYKTYEGTRDAKAMEEWLNQFAKTKSKRFSSYSELNDAIKRSKEPTVVAIFGDKDDIMVDMYLKAAKQVKDHWTYREVEFAHIFDEQASGRTGQLKAIGLEEGKDIEGARHCFAQTKMAAEQTGAQ